MDLAALLAALAEAETDEARAEVVASWLAGLEDRAEALATLRAEADARLDGDLTDESLDELTAIADLVGAIEAADAADAAADEVRRERAAEIAARLNPPAIEEVETPEVEVPEGEVETPEPELVDAVTAAAPPPAAPTPRVTRIAPRRPAIVAPRPASAQPGRLSLTAAANVPGINAGSEIRDYEQVAQVFGEAIRQSMSYRGGGTLKMPVLQASVQYPERQDFSMMNAAQATRAVEDLQRQVRAAGGMPALVAAGGICAPAERRYDQPILGDDARPVRDNMLLSVQASRGALATVPPPLLSDVTSGVDIWTAANDENPANPATKPCVTVTCETETETPVAAITRCLQAGNFQARFFAEQVEAWMNLLMVEHARVAEVNLLDQMELAARMVDVSALGEVLGTTRSVLPTLDRAVAGFRNAHRMDPRTPLVWAMPAWALDNIRADLTREAPGAAVERLATADATIGSFFAARNVRVETYWDGATGAAQTFPIQGAGLLEPWPDRLVGYLYVDGSFLFLDGGTLDLGVVRDSTLNATNDMQMFAETFEAAHFHGTQAYRIEIEVCANGEAAALADTSALCTSGS